MYKKLIKRGSKSYSYYYHNYRQGNTVRNVFLGNNLKQAKSNLNKFQSGFEKGASLSNHVPIPNRQSSYSGAILVALFLLVLGIGLFFFNPELTGLVTDNLIQQPTIMIEPETPALPPTQPETPVEQQPIQETPQQPEQSNQEEPIINQPTIIQPRLENPPAKIETLTHEQAEINKPVIWHKQIKLENLTNNFQVILPREASNIQINKQENNQILKVNNIITPITTLSGSNDQVLIINEPISNLSIAYTAPGPVLIESNQGHNIKVQISSDLPYTDVLSYASHNLSGNIRLIHEKSLLEKASGKYLDQDVTNNLSYNVSITNNQITWITPHLSTQYFFITNDTTDQPPSTATKFGKWSNGTFVNTWITNEENNVTLNSTTLGTGRNGNLTVSSATTINSYARLVNNESAGTTFLEIEAPSGLSNGDEIMIIQMQNWTSTGGTTAVGTYEFRFITSGGGTTNLTINSGLTNAYYSGVNANNTQQATLAQIVKIPHYVNVTIQNGGMLTALPWNGSAGGILAFRAKGIVWVQSGGMINVSGTGYRGGAGGIISKGGDGGESILGKGGTGIGSGVNTAGGGGGGGDASAATGGIGLHGGGGGGYTTAGSGSSTGGAGGGGAYNTGGGGAGYGTFGVGGNNGGGGAAGVNGTNTGTSGAGGSPGAGGGGGGGNYGVSDLSLLMFGSGGGAGGGDEGQNTAKGGNGGGIILINANNITVDLGGGINSTGENGSASTDQANGGAGAGGSILLRADFINIGTNLVRADGGAGSRRTGRFGGDGGVGRIKIENNILSGTTNPSASTSSFLNNYALTGNYTSEVFDAGLSATWNTLNWNEVNHTVTDINLSVRSCNDALCNGETFIFIGRNISASYTLNTSITPNNQYFQFLADFRTTNISLTSSLLDVNISYNRQPLNANLTSPTNNSVIIDTTPELAFANGTDTDGDQLNITVELSTTSNFVAINHIFNITQSADTKANVSVNLNQTIYWLRWRAYDGQAYSASYGYSNFTINSPPTWVNNPSNTNTNEDTAFNVDLSSNITDVESESIKISYQNNDTNLASISIANATHIFTFTPLANKFGVTSINLTLEEDLNSTYSDDFDDNSLNSSLWVKINGASSETTKILQAKSGTSDSQRGIVRSVRQFPPQTDNIINITVWAKMDGEESQCYICLRCSANSGTSVGLPSNGTVVWCGNTTSGTLDFYENDTSRLTITGNQSQPNMNLYDQYNVVDNGTTVRVYVNGNLSVQANINDSYRYATNYVAFFTREELYFPTRQNSASFDNFTIAYNNGSIGGRINWNITINSVSDNPLNANLTSPANNSILSDTTPELAFVNGTDADGDQLNISVDIATNSNFATIVHVFNITQSSDTKANITTTLNRTNYYLRWKDYDGVLYASDYKYSNFTINQLPSVNQTIIITNGTLVKNTKLNGSSSIFDNDTIQNINVTFKWYRNNVEQLNFTSLALNLVNGSTAYTPINVTNTSKEETWILGANASDGLESSSQINSSSIIIGNTPPLKANITSPLNNTIITDLTPSFNYTNGTDIDFDQMNITIWISTTNTFSNIVHVFNITQSSDTKANTSINLNRTTYFVNSSAYDGTAYSPNELSNFTINSLPSNANLTNPSNDSILTDLTPSLNFTNGTDLDGHQLNISLDIATNSNFATIVHVFNITQSSDTKANISVTLNRTNYYLRWRDYDSLEFTSDYKYSNFTMNSLPTFANTIANTNTNEDTAFSVDFTSNVTDLDNHAINITWGSNDTTKATITINNSTRVVTITPAINQSGIISFNLTLFDGLEYGTEINWNITINAVNDPPYWTGTPSNDYTNEETQDSVILSSFIADVDDSDNVLGISYSANDTAKATISLDNTSKNLSISPLANQTGIFSINLTIFDDAPASSSEIKQINWTIINSNDPPVISPDIGNKNVDEDNTFTLNLTQYGTDIDNSVDLNWSYSLNLTSLITIAINNNTDILTVTPATNQSGIAILSLTLFDNESLSDQETINFTVNAINDPPYWISDPVDQLTDEDTTGVYDISSIVADVDDIISVLGVAWQNNETDKATLTIVNSTKIVTFTTSANQTGRLRINFTIYDDDSLASPKKTINWDISNVNDPPVINPDIGDNQTDEDTTFTLNLTVYETDVDSVDFNWSWSLNGSSLITPSLNNATDVLTITPTANATGSAKLQLTLHDNVSSTDMQNITFHVIGVNDPPYINPFIANNASLTNGTFTYSLNNHANDIDGTDFNWSYKANSSIVTISINNNTDLLSIDTTNTTGVVSINLTLYDNASLTYTQNWNFTVAYNPSFISMFSYPTYIIVNATQTANVTIRLNQSTNASFTNLTIIDPNNVKSYLTTVNTTVIANNVYEYNYTFTPKTVGTYLLTFTLNDTAYPATNLIQRNATLYSVNPESVNFTAPGSQRITIKDVLTKEVLYSGTNSSILSNITLTNFPPGYYDLNIHSSDNKSFIIVENATVNATINETLNYTDIQDTLTLPVTGTTNINQFTLATNLSFVDANVTYAYIDNLSEIEHEESLAIFKCASNDSCSWVRLNRTIYENQNNLTAIINSFSVFNIIDQSPLNITTTTTTTSSGGGGGGATLADISIIQPSPVTLFKDDTTTTVIIIKNNGERTLTNIRVDTTSSNKAFEITVNPKFIPTLAVGQQAIVDLTISNIGLEAGDYEITIKATSGSPSLTDEAKFFIQVIPKYIVNKNNAEEQLLFLENLFNLNIQCSELRDLVQQSRVAFNNNDYDKSLELANSAIESCKHLISVQGGQLELPKKAEPLSDTIILMLELIAFLFVIMLVYNYYRKWRFKQRLRKR